MASQIDDARSRCYDYREAVKMGLALLILITSLMIPRASVIAQSRRPAPADGKEKTALTFEEAQDAQQRGDFSTAVLLYDQVIAANPGLYQAFYQRAVSLMALGRDDAAESDLSRVLELEPTFARAHRALGQLRLDRGRTKEAKQEFERSIKLDPKIQGVRVYYGSALLRDGDNAGAVEQLLLAISQGEESGLVQALLGLANERLGKMDEAARAYARAVELEPSNATAHEGRGRAFERMGEWAKAIEEYSQSYNAQPSPGLARKLAELHGRAGQPQAAIQLYRGLIRERPEDLDLRIELARAMAANDQAEDALKDLERLLVARPANAALLSVAGDLCFKVKPDLAAGYYSRALEAEPTDNRVRVQLGASLLRAKQYDRAAPVLLEAVTKEPDNYQARASLATAYFKLKQYLPAAQGFNWLVRKEPKTAVSYYFLAICLDRLGDCEQAFRAYQEFLRRADAIEHKEQIEESNIRLSLLQRLVERGKCKSPVKGKGK
jgi:tetratricopeptide (TPR) repeat protein